MSHESATDEIFLGRYQQRLEEKSREVEAAMSDQGEDGPANGTMLDVATATSLLDEIEAIKQEARDNDAVVVIKGLGRNVWREVKKKHPPRTQERDGVTETVAAADLVLGYNPRGDGIEEDIVAGGLVTPAFSSRSAFDEWLSGDPVTPGEWDRIMAAISERTFKAPFDPAAAARRWQTGNEDLKSALPTTGG